MNYNSLTQTNVIIICSAYYPRTDERFRPDCSLDFPTTIRATTTNYMKRTYHINVPDVLLMYRIESNGLQAVQAPTRGSNIALEKLRPAMKTEMYNIS